MVGQDDSYSYLLASMHPDTDNTHTLNMRKSRQASVFEFADLKGCHVKSEGRA